MWSSGILYQNSTATAGSVTLKNGKAIKVSYNKATGKIEDTAKTVDCSDVKSVPNNVNGRTVVIQDGADKVARAGGETSAAGLSDSSAVGQTVETKPGKAKNAPYARYWWGDAWSESCTSDHRGAMKLDKAGKQFIKI
jgi:hypothetical protein